MYIYISGAGLTEINILYIVHIVVYIYAYYLYTYK